MLRMSDAWWFMFFYAVTFGGFVGLASSLAIYFNTDYGLDAVTAGYFTAACVFCGSLVRPIGGALADRIGGIKTLSVMYALAALALVVVSFRPQSVYVALALFACGMLAFGMGNGSVFQLVPQRFRHEIGVMTGTRRHDRRHRRILPRLEPGLVQTTHRQLSGRLARVRIARGAGAGGPHASSSTAGGRPGARWASRARASERGGARPVDRPR